ncbi:MAG: serine/threonine-protein phosphatase [Acidimicrobiaceae bacterium]|nr:serine/threonine-protein phosphatase [Acidimicrobiaceae bacterium]
MQGDPDRLFRTRRPPLPRTELAGFDLAAAWSPWDEASGDLCDWYPSQAGGLTLTVGDVMGMGAPAATLAARLRRALQAASRQAGLAEAVSSTAQHLELHSTTTLVTLLHATLRSDGRLSYIDAGHGLDVLVRDGRLHRLDVRGVPLGVADDSIWQVGQDRLAPGDTLVAFTDGLMDLHGGLEETFSAILDLVTAEADVQATADALAWQTWFGEQTDDVTVVVARRQAQ